jgi:hypothetical protein
LLGFGFVNWRLFLVGLDRRCGELVRLLKRVLKTAKTHKLRSTKPRLRLSDTKVHSEEAFDTIVHVGK